MKTPSTTNNSLTPTKPNTGSNPMNTPKTSRNRTSASILVGSIATLSGLAVPTNSDAAVAPYASADANTTHLWHFDEALVGASPYNNAGRLFPVDVVDPTWRMDDGYYDATYLSGIMGGTGYTGFNGTGLLDHGPNHFEFRKGGGAAGYVVPNEDGNTGNITATQLLGSSSGAFTIEGMIKWDGGQGGTKEGFLFKVGEDSFSTRLRLTMQNAGTSPVFRLGLPNTGANNTFTTTATIPALTTTDWYHYAVTFDGNNAAGSNLKFYWTKVDPLVNAQAKLVETFVSTGTTAYDINNSFSIGNWNGGNFDGLVDEVRISNNARSSRQMLFTADGVNSLAAGDWNVAGTWNPSGVPTVVKAVTVANAVTIDAGVSATPATSFALTVSGGGSVVMTNQSLTVVGDLATDLNTTGGTLALDATSTLTIPNANTSVSLPGVTFVSGSTLNITNELTVDSSRDLTVTTLITPKVTLASGTLTNNKAWSIASLNVAGGALDLGGNNLTVTNTLTIGGALDMTAPALGNLTVNGATVRLNSGTLTLDTAATPDVLVYAGGALAGPGSVIPNVRYEVLNTTVSSNLLNGTGSTALTATGGVSVLSGTNTYTGVTTINSGATLSVSNLQNAGVASNLGAYATPGAAGIVLSGGTLRYTGSTMDTAIDRGITLTASSTVDLPIAGDMRLGSLALASAAAMDINVTGNGVAASRLYIDSVTVPTSTVSRQGPVFKPNTASLTIGSITGNGNFQMQGAVGASDNIITGPINLGAGNTTADQDQIYGPIAANTWTIMSENTFPGRWYAAAGVVKIKSPGNLGSPNVSTAFGNGNWPGTAQGTTKFYNGNTVVQLLNDLSTSYENGSGQRASVRTGGSNATFNVGPQGTATGQTHKLGNLWIHDNNMNVNVNSINASGAVTANGYGLTFDEVRIRDSQTGTFVANTTLGLAGITKSSGSGTSHLRFDGTGTTTVTGTAPVHPGGTLNITKLGGGTLIFNGLNTYNGTTAVTGGTLVAAHDTSLGTTGSNTTVGIGATLDVRAALVAEPISVTGTGVLGAGALITADNTPNTAFTGTVGGTVTLTGATSIGGHGNGTLNINGTVAAGAHTLTTLGTGVTTFGAASTLTTLTNLVVADGTTNVNSALGTGSSVVTVTDAGNGTKLRFGSVSQTLSSLTIGAGATVIFTSGLASGALTGDDGGGKAAGFGSPASSFGGGVTVPEPTSAMLLLVGALGMLNRRRRQA